MKQTCKFITEPLTVHNGGFLKGRFIVWLNLCVKNLAAEDENGNRYESLTDRLALADNTVDAFLDAADFQHLCLAEDWETEEIIRWLGAENDIEAWAKVRKAQIEGYDKSDMVNSFTLDSHKIWFDKSTRLGLARMYQIIGDSEPTPSMWYGGTEIEMPSSERALEILREMEIYAMRCFAATQHALGVADKLLEKGDLEGLKTLRYQDGYPAPLAIEA